MRGEALAVTPLNFKQVGEILSAVEAAGAEIPTAFKDTATPELQSVARKMRLELGAAIWSSFVSADAFQNLHWDSRAKNRVDHLSKIKAAAKRLDVLLSNEVHPVKVNLSLRSNRRVDFEVLQANLRDLQNAVDAESRRLKEAALDEKAPFPRNEVTEQSALLASLAQIYKKHLKSSIEIKYLDRIPSGPFIAFLTEVYRQMGLAPLKPAAMEKALRKVVFKASDKS